MSALPDNIPGADDFQDFLDFLDIVLRKVTNKDGTIPYVFTAECSEMHTVNPERLKAMIGA